MTSSIRENFRARSRTDEETPSLAGLVVQRLRAQREASTQITWPDTRYQNDPVGFFENVLGVITWDGQERVLNACAKHRRVSCRSGRRVSKSMNAAGIGLWRYTGWPFARVVLSSTTARQVDAILWRELTMLRARSGRCVNCIVDDPLGRGPKPCRHSALIDGEIGQLARTGLKSFDDHFREVFGCTAREGEAMQGLSGPAMQFIVDEGSGVPDQIFEAIEGNLAGGGWSLYLGNPTKTRGTFFNSFGKNKYDPDHPERGGIFAIHISSLESPNIDPRAREKVAQRFDRIAREATRATARDTAMERARGIREHRLDVHGHESLDVIPGLANAEWVREREREWGTGSPLFAVHVEGNFATNEDGKIFSIEAIEAAKARHAETLASGALWIGLDPAGETGTGDESCFAPRRGMRQLELHAKRGLNDDGHITELRALVARHRSHEREIVYVVVDRSGSIGSSLYGRLRAQGDEQRIRGDVVEFEVIGVMPSAAAQRQPNVYDTLRDELAANLEAKFREGAAIVDDVKLDAELHVLEWRQLVNGLVKVTAKEQIKKELGRSPDRYDATAMSWWEPLHLRAPEVAATSPGPAPPEAPRAERRFDPFAGRNRWRR